MASHESRETARDRLSQLLLQAESPQQPEWLAGFLAGAAAAPETEDEAAWAELLAPEAEEELRAALREARAEARPAPDTSSIAERLAALRAELKHRGLTGFLVPRADEHQGEYVTARAERLAWISGFTGSAGMAVIMLDKAAIFVDGRYTLQAEEQVESALFERCHLTERPPREWLAENLVEGQRLGFDPWLHTPNQLAGLREAVERTGAQLVACESNPLDAVWQLQPPPPIAPAVPHPEAFAGRSSADKRAEIAAAIKKARANAVFLSAPDSIAWLLNIRGADVPRTPFVLSFALLHEEGRVEWFVDRRKLVPALFDHLGDAVALEDPESLAPAIDALGAGGRAVLADPSSAPCWVFDRLEAAGARVIRGADPCQRPKAIKNETELAGARAAHVRDGAAVSAFLRWIKQEAPRRARSGEPVTESEAADRLHELRRRNERFRDLSFDTISGSGPNGAVVHYRVTEASDRGLREGELYLVDSGAQYLDGTTDITRTLAIGEPSEEMRANLTRVLKGHIAIATIRFPKGTTGSQLDSLARAPLWRAGLDYDHGTGHGVGSYLSVHEGPQRVSKAPNKVALEPGMIVSNEPGYYRSGAYGIRIENLVAVREAETLPGQDRDMLCFETLSLAPIDRDAIEPALLSDAEREWLDAYHARVRETLSPLLDKETAAWLAEVTRPLGH